MMASHLHPRVLLNLEEAQVDPRAVRSKVDEGEQFVLLQTHGNGRGQQDDNGGNILQKKTKGIQSFRQWPIMAT